MSSIQWPGASHAPVHAWHDTTNTSQSLPESLIVTHIPPILVRCSRTSSPRAITRHVIKMALVTYVTGHTRSPVITWSGLLNGKHMIAKATMPYSQHTLADMEGFLHSGVASCQWGVCLVRAVSLSKLRITHRLKIINKLQSHVIYLTRHSSLTTKANVVRLSQSLWKNPCQESNLMELKFHVCYYDSYQNQTWDFYSIGVLKCQGLFPYV